LGPIPNMHRLYPGHGPPLRLCANCLSKAHSGVGCVAGCRQCLSFGHNSRNCNFPPQSVRPGLSAASNSRSNRISQSLKGGAPQTQPPRLYHSMPQYIKEVADISSIPSPVTVR
jgi:hypothetical protein